MKIKIFTLIVGVLMSVSLFAQDNYVVLRSMASTVKITDGDKYGGIETYKVLNQFKPDETQSNKGNPIELSCIQVNDGDYNEAQKWVVTQATLPDGTDDVGYFWLVPHGSTYESGTTPNVNNDPLLGLPAVSGINDAFADTWWCNPSDDNPKWFVQRIGGKYLICHKADFENNPNALTPFNFSYAAPIGTALPTEPTGGVNIWTYSGVDTRDIIAEGETFEVTGQNATEDWKDVWTSDSQKWEYFDTEGDAALVDYERVVNFDPLAKFIHGSVDGGVIEEIELSGEIDIQEEVTITINSDLDAGGGDNDMTYSWWYSVDGGANSHLLPLDNDEEYKHFYQKTVALEDLGDVVTGAGQTLLIGRLVTDGTYNADGTVEENSGTWATSNYLPYTLKGTRTALGVDNAKAASIKMFPNPAKASVSISAKEFSSIEMFNTLGQSVLILEGGKDIQVNTSEFNKGIYLVRFSNKDTAVTKRLVIE